MCCQGWSVIIHCDNQIDHGHMRSCDDRQSLIKQLLTQAVNLDQLVTLVKLLQSWPDPMYAVDENVNRIFV